MSERNSGDTGGMVEGARRLTSVLLQPWLATFVVLQGAGWWIYYQQVPIDQFDLPVYLLSAVCSAALLLALNLGRDALGTVGRILVGVAVASLTALVLVASYKSHVEFGEFISASMVSYAGKGGVSTYWNYLQTYLEYPLDVVTALTTLSLAAVWAVGPEVDLFDRDVRAYATGGVIGLFAVTLAATALFAHRRHLAPDTSVLSASVRSMFMPVDDRLHEPEREPVPDVPPSDPRTPPNIVLVINESLGTHEVDFSDDANEEMPYVESWLASDPNRTFAFRRAYANSTSTDVSVPTMLTGIGPERPPEQLHAAPLAWQWGRKAGLAPFYVSSQNYSATNFPEFFFADDRMPVLRPNTIEELDRSGDFSVDELFVADTFAEQLREMPDDQPVFAVYNSNAMHKPFQATSPRLEEPPERGSRYRNALFVLDRAIKRIVEALERDGRLERTLFIMTADHGEYPERHHRVPRILSTYEEFTRVPLVVRVPETWPDRRSGQIRALRNNLDRNVANIDIVPTIVDTLEFDRMPAREPLLEQLSGHSLLQPVPRDRMIYLLNNNAVRHWEHKSFGLYWKDWRFVFSDVQGPRLFDISEDPEQQHDLWENAPEPVRQKFLDEIEQHTYLTELWEGGRPHGTPGLHPIFH